MSLRTGVTCAPEDTQRALTSTQCGSEDWHTLFLPGLWVSCHLPSAHCAWTSASVLWKWAATATGEALATWLRMSTHLTRASLADALFAFKVSVETMLTTLSSALAPFKYSFFSCKSHKVWSFWLCPLHMSLISLCF